MSRWEFMRQLEELLSDISPAEREEALQYYNDYFNDAGRENEQEVIKALGSPAQVAEIVRDGLNENSSSGEFTERGFNSAAASQQNPIIKKEDGTNSGEEDAFKGQDGKADAGGSIDRDTSGKNGDWQAGGYGESQSGHYRESQSGSYGQNQSGNYGNTGSGNYQQSGTGGYGAYAYAGEVAEAPEEKKEGLATWAVVLLIIGCVILAPAILGGIGGILGGLLGIVAAIACLVLGIGVAAVALYIAAVLLVVAGIGYMFVSPVTGIGLLGGGCICGALGILCMLFTYFMAGKWIPGICRGIGYLFRKLTGKKGGGMR